MVPLKKNLLLSDSEAADLQQISEGMAIVVWYNVVTISALNQGVPDGNVTRRYSRIESAFEQVS